MAERIIPPDSSLWFLYNKKAFSLPMQSSYVDPSLLWYWIQLTYEMGIQHGRFKNEFKLTLEDRYSRCWYDKEHEENDRYTVTYIEVTFKQTGLKRLYWCHAGPKPQNCRKWTEIKPGWPIAYSGETGHPIRGKWPPGRSEATLGIS